jgi:hypothetical protein
MIQFFGIGQKLQKNNKTCSISTGVCLFQPGDVRLYHERTSSGHQRLLRLSTCGSRATAYVPILNFDTG